MRMIRILLLLAVGVWAVDQSVTSNHLRVSIRNQMLQDATSCIAHIAQIELFNVHATDPIEIRGISSLEEATEAFSDDLVLGEGNLEDADEATHCLSLPRQIYANPIQTLTIGPGQLAVVPVAFLPRFPEPPAPESKEIPDLQRLASKPLAALSDATERYAVTSQLQIETNAEKVTLPIEASSQRQNPLGLPDAIYFDDTAQPWTPDPRILDQWTTVYDETSPCYQLHLERGLQISHISVTHPEFSLRRGAKPSTNRMESFGSVFSELTIPDDGQAHFVVEICRQPPDVVHDVPSWLHTTARGFLQLRTLDEVTHFVQLETTRAPGVLYRQLAQQTVHPPQLQYPERLDIPFYQRSLPVTRQTIVLRNMAQPVRIMSVAVVVETPVAGVNVTLSIPDDGPLVDTQNITLECQIDRELFNETLDGVVRIRGTAYDIDFPEWTNTVPFDLPGNFELEIPFSVSLDETFVVFWLEESSHPLNRFSFYRQLREATDTVAGCFFPDNRHHVNLQLSDAERQSTDEHFMQHILRGYKLNRTQPMSITEAEIVPQGSFGEATCPICDRFKAQVLDDLKKDTDLLDVVDLGRVQVKYTFPKPPGKCVHTIYPEACYLRMKTQPDSGIHEFPLMVYSGRFEVSGGHQEPPPSALVVNTKHSIVGLDAVVEWFRESKSGFALRSVLRERTGSSDLDSSLLTRYLMTLVPTDENYQKPKLHPIVFEAGAVSQGEIETVPLHFTNHNPVPIVITVDVSAVEGQYVAIGKTEELGVLDHIKALDPNYEAFFDGRVQSGKYEGHPFQGLRQFLLTDRLATRIIRRFAHRDDISFSERALARNGLLRTLFRREVVGAFQKSKNNFKRLHDEPSKCDTEIHPSFYGPFQKKLSVTGKKLRGPLLMSTDRRTVRRLTSCSADDRSPRRLIQYKVPPGGVARFDVTIRAPTSSVLEKDITQFVGTGLVLSTDHGEFIPIIVSFEAFKGRLELSHVPSVGGEASVESSDADTIHVPPGLFSSFSDTETVPVTIPPHSIRSLTDFTSGGTIVPRNVSTSSTGVSLYMKSSFLRKIHLRRVVSCNPWFEVELANETVVSDPFLGVHIGVLRSIVGCDAAKGVPDNKTMFPSFYRCALSWLARRYELQKSECGAMEGAVDLQEMKRRTNRSELTKIIQSLRRAVVVSELNDEYLSSAKVTESPATVRKSGRRGIDSTVPPVVVESLFAANAEIKKAAESGYLSHNTNLHVVVEYNATPEEISPVAFDTKSVEQSRHLLSLAIQNVTVKSRLETPTLLRAAVNGEPSVVMFPPTRIASTSSMMIPIYNPTGIPIRVRLAVHSPTNRQITIPFIQDGDTASSKSTDYTNKQWWDGDGAYFIPDFHGDLIRSNRNITASGGESTRVSFVSPSAVSFNAFLHGCGAQCGVSTEKKMKKVTDTIGMHQMSASPIGSSAAAGVTLTSSSAANVKLTISRAGRSMPNGAVGPEAFGIPFSSRDEIIVPPHTEAQIGPVFFRPPGRSSFLGCSALKNVGTSEEVKQCSENAFESTVLLENSLTGYEKVTLKGKALWEHIDFVDPSESEAGELEVRHGRPTLRFPGTMDPFGPIEERNPMVKKVAVFNAGEIPVRISKGYLREIDDWRGRTKSQTGCSMGQFTFMDCDAFPFELMPGDIRPIRVEHRPRCTRQRHYVRLTLESEPIEDAPSESNDVLSRAFKSRRQRGSLRHSTIDLMVGFEMDAFQFSFGCIPLPIQPAVSSKLGIGGIEKADGLSVALWTVYAFVNYVHSRVGSLPFVLLVVVMVLLRRRLSWLNRSIILYARYIDYTEAAFQTGKRGTSWTMMFRILARLDPSAGDLQNLTRGKTRMREQHSSSNQDGSSNRPSFSRTSLARKSDRVRTSEAIFRSFNPHLAGGDGRLPLNLGWRVAASKGVINSKSIEQSPLQFKTHELLLRRKAISPRKGKEKSDFSDFDGTEAIEDELPVPVEVITTKPPPIVTERSVESIVSEEPEPVPEIIPEPSPELSLGPSPEASPDPYPEPPPKLPQTLNSPEPCPEPDIKSLPEASHSLPVEPSSDPSSEPSSQPSPKLEPPYEPEPEPSSEQKLEPTPQLTNLVNEPTKTDDEVVATKPRATKKKSPQKAKSKMKETSTATGNGTLRNTSSHSLRSEKSTKINSHKTAKAEKKEEKQQKNPAEKKSKKKKEQVKKSSSTVDKAAKKTPKKSKKKETPTEPARQLSVETILSPPVSPSIRPPPGLAPPPGFDGDSPLFAPTNELTAFLNASAKDTAREALDRSPLSLPKPTAPDADLAELLAFGKSEEEPILDENPLDFNVMDFLDGILDDTNNSSSGLVSSRAAAYGIEIEENDEDLKLPSWFLEDS